MLLLFNILLAASGGPAGGRCVSGGRSLPVDCHFFRKKLVSPMKPSLNGFTRESQTINEAERIRQFTK